MNDTKTIHDSYYALYRYRDIEYIILYTKVRSAPFEYRVGEYEIEKKILYTRGPLCSIPNWVKVNDIRHLADKFKLVKQLSPTETAALLIETGDF